MKRLSGWHNKVYSHLSLDVVLNPNEFNANTPLSFADIKTLIDRAFTILNRYSGLFTANYYSKTMIGHDDYLWVLKTAKEALQTYEARIEAQFKAVQTALSGEVSKPSTTE